MNLIEKIGDILQSAQTNIHAFKTTLTNKHVIVFLGNTKSGKSTLVNYIIGTKLVAFEERKPIFKIKKANEDSEGPAIGQGSQSCTTFPNVYPLNKFGMIIIDAPGFDDNRGEAQDIINALYINQIKHAKTVKFVLVCDINELIMDNIKGFTDLIEKIYGLFPNFENFKSSVSIVFTKDYRQYSQSDVVLLLKNKLLDVDGFGTHINKQMVKYFVDNEQLIAIFRMPTNVGNVGHEIDVNIEGARVGSCALVLNEKIMKVTLSPKARLVLLSIYQKYLDSTYFENELKQVLARLEQYFETDDYVFASTDDELNDEKQNLRHISNAVQNEIQKNMLNLNDISDSLTKSLPITLSPVFVRTFTVLRMIDNNSLMEEVIRNKFISKYKDSLKSIVEKVTKLSTKIDEEIKTRNRDREIFKASAIAGGVGGGAAVVGEVLFRACSNAARLASPFGLIGLIGSVVGGIGASAAGTSYLVQKETQRRRIEARRRQGREVYDGMFEEN